MKEGEKRGGGEGTEGWREHGGGREEGMEGWGAWRRESGMGAGEEGEEYMFVCGAVRTRNGE